MVRARVELVSAHVHGIGFSTLVSAYRALQWVCHFPGFPSNSVNLTGPILVRLLPLLGYSVSVKRVTKTFLQPAPFSGTLPSPFNWFFLFLSESRLV